MLAPFQSEIGFGSFFSILYFLSAIIVYDYPILYINNNINILNYKLFFDI